MSRPIRILYDEWGFQETHGGVSRLFSEVMKNLPEGFEWILPQTSTVNEYLKAPPFNLPPAKLTFRDFVRKTLHGHYFPGANRLYKLLGNLFPRQFPAYEVVSRRERMRALTKGNYDIYHCGALEWNNVPTGKPFVVTVCDLIPEIVTHNQMMGEYRKRVLAEATHVIAITEYTKRDVMRLYGVPSEKISVIYLGYNMKDSLYEAPSQDVDIWNDPYVLFVGKRDGYKNFSWMVKALAPFLRGEGYGASCKNKLRVFCTGKSFNQEEKALFRELGVEGQLSQKFVTDEEMLDLFHRALCFIHPSIYEGFGIPILDAFAAGCPALLANASCFPEVAGDAAVYFDPTNLDDFRRKFALLYDPNGLDLRKNLISKAKSRVRDFSWKKCAEETAAVYKMVYEKSLRYAT